MELLDYLATNIPLFSAVAIMFFIAFRNLKVRKKESIFFIFFSIIVLMLTVVVYMERFAQRKGLPEVGTVFTSLGYILRPILLFIFVLLANMDQKRKRVLYVICISLMVINSLIYMLPFFFNVPALSKLVFYYQMQPDGTASFERGTFLNFSSHAVCVAFMALLIYVSTIRFHGKHRRDGLVLILCVIIVSTTTIVETITGRNDLLNIVSIICAMINYIFIMSVNSSRDPLTNLYDRRMYYEDISRYQDSVNGIIQIDMNELKYFNDNFGHGEGDKALTTLAYIFESSVVSSVMCAYRLSGDEFLILMFQGKQEQLIKTVNSIKYKMGDTHYSAAIGYYFIDPKEKISFEEAMKKSESLMYEDKDKHYQESGHKRR